MASYKYWILFCLLLLGVVGWLIVDAFQRHQRRELSAKAYEFVERAIETSDRTEKKRLFNEALFNYLTLENGYSQNPDLNEAIGDLSLELGELPYAALYFSRTLHENPREERVQTKAEQVFERLGQPFPFRKSGLSTRESILIIILLAILVWTLSWYRFQKLAWVACLLAIVLCSWLLYEQWGRSGQGLVISPDYIRLERESVAILPGTVVKVLKIYPEQELLLVRLPDGREGYLDMAAAAAL